MKLLNKIKDFFKRLFATRRRKIIGVIVLILLIIAGAFLATRSKEQEQQTVQIDESAKYYSLLSGNEVSQDESNRPILAVMIENSYQARPQTGLSSAGIVFESVTEGGITRYLALFQENRPKEVGPVRSVRPPFVNWLTGFDASVAHVGGSNEGLSLIKQLNTKDLDQFRYSEPYYRVNSRPAPHNMYASVEKLASLQKELDHKKSTSSPFERSDDTPLETPVAKSISINYSSDLFAALFQYEKPTNSYKRFLAEEKHVDAAPGKQISVKNLVVINVLGSNSNNIKAIGSGKATVFKDGNKLLATWKMLDTNNRIQLLDTQGNEIPLNRGNTWFAVVPETGTFTAK